MCFYVDDKHSKSYIAKEDIICYKIMDYKLDEDEEDNRYIISSPWIGMNYNINELYKLKEPLVPIRFAGIVDIYTNTIHPLYIINEGFHSYTKLRIAKDAKDQYDGITSPRNVSVFRYYNKIVVKCIIPKGAEYYINNKDDEYISNAIIVKEIIKI